MNKSRWWNFINSIWIIVTFILFINWSAFLYIGIRVRKKVWLIWSAIYFILGVIIPFWVEDHFKNSAFDDVFFILFIGGYVGGIVHAFAVRKEYLMNLMEMEKLECKDEISVTTSPIEEFEVKLNNYEDNKDHAIEYDLKKSICQVVRNYGIQIVLRRWLATAIDFTIGFAVFGLLSLENGDNSSSLNIKIVIGYFAFQYLVFESLLGYTIGKFIAGIKVIDENGDVIGLAKGLIRTFFRLIEVNPLVLGGIPAGIIAAVSSKKQRIGDMLANTYVLKVKDLELIKDYHKDELVSMQANSVKKMLTLKLVLSVSIIVLLLSWVKLPNFSEGLSSFDNVSTNISKSKDEKIQIELPSGWKEQKSYNNYGYDIFATNYNKDLYVAVVKIPKKVLVDEITLDNYLNVIQENQNYAIKNSTMGNACNIKINGKQAKQYEVTGVVDYMKLTYITTLVETGDSFYEILSWTTKQNYEANKSELEKVTNSFKEVEISDL